MFRTIIGVNTSNIKLKVLRTIQQMIIFKNIYTSINTSFIHAYIYQKVLDINFSIITIDLKLQETEYENITKSFVIYDFLIKAFS